MFGISTASDAKENRETYQASLPLGDASITPSYDGFVDPNVQGPTDWDRVTAEVRRQAPGATVARTPGRAVGPKTWPSPRRRECSSFPLLTPASAGATSRLGATS